MELKKEVIMIKVKVGIVGLGIMGQLYADALIDNPLADLNAVVYFFSSPHFGHTSIKVTVLACFFFKGIILVLQLGQKSIFNNSLKFKDKKTIEKNSIFFS